VSIKVASTTGTQRGLGGAFFGGGGVYRDRLLFDTGMVGEYLSVELTHVVYGDTP